MKTTDKRYGLCDAWEAIKLNKEGIESLKEALNSLDNKHSVKEYLTRQEVAKTCRVRSMNTLWVWNKKGILKPGFRAGRKPLYKYEDVIEFLTYKAA